MTVVGLFHHRGGVDKGGKAMLAGQSSPGRPLRASGAGSEPERTIVAGGGY